MKFSATDHDLEPPRPAPGPLPGAQARVVELRIHGIMGITAEALTDSVAAVDVAGDTAGRIVRPADRLLRPAPGPVLHADGRPVPRIVEGYLWSRMTSGGWAKATWALLFPFALANVAHWMLPPVPADSRAARALGALLRALLRLAAILLTMLLVGQVAVLSLDLLAGQCLAPGAPCLRSVPDWWRAIPVIRPLAGLLPVGGLVFLLHRVSAVDWTVTGGPVPDSPGKDDPRLPGDALAADPDTPALRTLHSVAALGTVSLLALGGPFGPAHGAHRVLWMCAALLVAGSVLITVALDDPTGKRGARPHPVRAALRPIVRRGLRWIGGALLVATAVVLDPTAGPAAQLHGADTTVESIGALLVAVCVAVAVLLAPAAVLARPAWARLPRRLRPWAGGWMAAPILVLGCLLGGGFGAGVAITVRNVLGGGLRLPASYDELILLWGAGAVLAVGVAAVAVPVLLLRRWAAERRGTVPPELTVLHAGREGDVRRAARAWWRASVERDHAQHLLLALSVVLSAGALVALAVRVGRAPLVYQPLPYWANLLSGLGVATLAALAIGLLRTVYLAARRPDTARRLGALTDIASFWPREAHPIVPPCYALKVIPEVATRAAEHLADPDTRVVITGHSQGSLLAAVATARLLDAVPAESRNRIGLITAGSPLQWAYPRAFPAVVSHRSLARLTGLLGGRWRALCRGTDPLGGPVCTWDRQVYGGRLLGAGFRSDGGDGPLPPAVPTESGALVLGADHWLPDPARGPWPGRRWHPGVLGHADFTVDPEWDHAVAIAAGLAPPPAAGQAAEAGPPPSLGANPAITHRPPTPGGAPPPPGGPETPTAQGESRRGTGQPGHTRSGARPGQPEPTEDGGSGRGEESGQASATAER